MGDEAPSRFGVPDGYDLINGELVKIREKPPPPSFHREEAVKPFNSYEWGLIAKYAPELTWNLRSGVQVDDHGEWKPGFESVPDPSFVWDTCLVLYATATHISKLHSIGPTDVWFDEEAKWWKVNINRTKPGTASMRMVSPPIPDDFSPWIRSYLAKPKPRLGWSYNHMFNQLSDLIERATRSHPVEGRLEPGVRLHINALRFRHSGAVRFKLEYNVIDQLAAEWAGCTVRTLQRYARAPDAAVLAAIRSRGQAKSLFSGKGES